MFPPDPLANLQKILYESVQIILKLFPSLAIAIVTIFITIILILLFLFQNFTISP
jgi:hypothetical protein